MVNKLWKNYNAKYAYDGYFTEDNKLRKHATIISIFQKDMEKKNFKKSKKIVKVLLVQEELILEYTPQIIELKKKNGLSILYQE